MSTALHKTAAEARRYERKNVKIPALLYCHNRFQRVTISNLSRGGAGLEGAFGIMPGVTVKLELIDRRIIKATVAWVVGDRVGLQFSEVLPADDILLEPGATTYVVATPPDGGRPKMTPQTVPSE